MAGFEASMVDRLVAIAAAAIASGCGLSGGGAATTAPAGAAGAAIATATGVAVVAVIGCDATASTRADGSGAETISNAAFLPTVFTLVGLAASSVSFGGWSAASPFESVAPGAALDCCDRGGALEEAVALRRSPCDAGDASSSRRCGEGRSDAVVVDRSFAAVSALLSISAEKPSAGAWSGRADRGDALGTDKVAVSDVTLSTASLSR
jgi:hypothetical protein